MADFKSYKIIKKQNGEILKFGKNVILEHIENGETLFLDIAQVASLLETPEEGTMPRNADIDQRENQHFNNDQFQSATDVESFKWSDLQTNFMLGLFEENMDNIGPLKKFRVKKLLWEFLAQKCSAEFQETITPEQVTGRFKTIIRRAKGVIKHNRTSGAVRKDMPYKDILQKIISADDSLFPEIRLGPNKIEIKTNQPSIKEQPCCSSQPLPSPTTINFSETDESTKTLRARKRTKTLQEKLLDKCLEEKRNRNEEKEQKKQQRHEEKMAALADFAEKISTLFSIQY